MRNKMISISARFMTSFDFIGIGFACQNIKTHFLDVEVKAKWKS